MEQSEISKEGDMDDYTNFVAEIRRYLNETSNRMLHADIESSSIFVETASVTLTDMSQERFMALDIFQDIDDNNSGTISLVELQEYIKKLTESIIFDQLSEDQIKRFTDMVVEQIDIDRDGSITVGEIRRFLTSGSSENRELGILLNLVRVRIIELCKVEFNHSDEELMSRIAKPIKAILLQGRPQVASQSVKKLLFHLKIPTEYGGKLSKEEVNCIMLNIYANSDGIVTGREFRPWLFPVESKADVNNSIQRLVSLIKAKFFGRVKTFFQFFRDNCTYLDIDSNTIGLSDFIDTMRKMKDSGFSMKEIDDLVKALFHNAKNSNSMITLNTITDLIGNHLEESILACKLAEDEQRLVAIQAEKDRAESDFFLAEQNELQRLEKARIEKARIDAFEAKKQKLKQFVSHIRLLIIYLRQTDSSAALGIFQNIEDVKDSVLSLVHIRNFINRLCEIYNCNSYNIGAVTHLDYNPR